MATHNAITEERENEIAEQCTAYFKSALQEFKSGRSSDLPFLSAFCREVAHISQNAFLEHAKQNESLDAALKISKEIQKEILILGGLKGRFNPTFAIFSAKNMTDMRDKVEVEGANNTINIIQILDGIKQTNQIEAQRVKLVERQERADEKPILDKGQGVASETILTQQSSGRFLPSEMVKKYNLEVETARVYDGGDH